MKRATSGVSGHCGVSEISRIGAESLERTGPTGLGHVSSPFSKPRCETQWSSSLQRELPLRTTPQRGVRRRVRGSPMDRTNGAFSRAWRELCDAALDLLGRDLPAARAPLVQTW